MPLRRSRRVSDVAGFTLAELMVVILILAFLLLIAFPNYVRAREQGFARGCSSNLKEIQTAVAQYAMENHLPQGAPIPDWVGALVGNGSYLKNLPECPEKGSYTVTNIDNEPTCTSTTAAYPHTISGM